MYLDDFIEEKYKSYDDVNLYYDGFLDYGKNENLKDYINEFALYDKIKSISDELYFDYEIDNEFIKYRGRELNEYDNLNEFVYYNDIIINTYMYMWSVEEFNIDILKTYFTDGTFLLEGEYLVIDVYTNNDITAEVFISVSRLAKEKFDSNYKVKVIKTSIED